MIFTPMLLLALSTSPDLVIRQAQKSEMRQASFTYVAASDVKRVDIVGTFNNWSIGANPMVREGNGNTWHGVIDLLPGTYQYKFVLDGANYVVDPNATSAGDGNGNTNSLLTIRPEGYDTPAVLGDGKITYSALKHSTEVPDLNFDHGMLQLSLRARPGDIASISVRLSTGKSYPLHQVGEDDVYARYVATIPWDRTTNLSYSFLLTDGRLNVVFGPKGVSKSSPGNEFSLNAATYKPFVVPDWVEHSVIYQIFPDRFANGDPSNDPANVVPWGSQPTFSTRMGGDFAGVQQHLNYLKSLGISCVYYNPIFQSPVYHRYETTDYHLVDKELGTNAEFIDLAKKMRSMGIRTVLDGVFNHSATDFFAFKDVVKNGADSPYTHWYTFKGFPVRIGENPNYVAWFNYPSMPKFNHANPEVQKYLLGVPGYWDQRTSIAGWRLDAANEVPDAFWKKFRATVKSLHPDDWIVGEEWGDASHWLKGDMWDSVMNYPFLFATLGFVGKDGDGLPSTYWKKLLANYSNYAPQVSRNLMNLVGSHDTPRVLDQCGSDRKLANLAALLEFSWVGAPTVYYGDELGMAGGKDPDDRRGMEWDNAIPTNPTLAFYRRLIAARNASPELQSGEPVLLAANDGQKTLAFARVLKNKFAVTVVNRTDDASTVAIQLGTLNQSGLRLFDAISGKEYRPAKNGTLNVTLDGKSGALLIPEYLVGYSIKSNNLYPRGKALPSSNSSISRPSLG